MVTTVPRKMLLMGATGFIGGTVLQQLLDSSDVALGSVSITAAVRRSDQADLLARKGVRAVVVSGLEDAPGLEQAASEHDIVVNVATGFHAAAAEALIHGLGRRREQTGTDVHFMHLSGTTCVAIPSLTPSPFDLRTFSDYDPDLYEYELLREAHQPYGQTTADITVVQTGERCQVKTYIVMPPTVYGNGTGWFKTQSHQIPTLIRNALKTGYAEHVDTGTVQLGHVHVVDLARLYTLLVGKALAGENVPSGRSGYYFANAGSHQWIDVTRQIGKIGWELGVLQSAEPRSISLQEATGKFADGDVKYAEACFASNSSTRAHKAYDLGWKPVETESLEASIKETFVAVQISQA